VGDPLLPSWPAVLKAVQKGLDCRQSQRYPSYEGEPAFRQAAAAWMKRRFHVDVDPETEVVATIGSKEAVFNFHEGIVNPGDVVLAPSPGYPPYTRGTIFAEGEPWTYPLLKEHSFLPPLDWIPEEAAARARLIWINYPNNPTGAVATPSFLEELVVWGREKDVLIASDEAYTDVYFDSPPPSILQYSREGVIAFFSLSKRSAMTGYRIGWAAGDERAINVLKKVKTNIDSGVPFFIQEGAVAALEDEHHVGAIRDEYAKRRKALADGLRAAGLPVEEPPATLYLWQAVPQGYTSESFMRRLLEPDLAIITMPGPWLGDPLRDGSNPGEGYVRFALSPTLEQTLEGAERLARVGHF
jgi:LL-diaminopimelate aminotransferase